MALCCNQYASWVFVSFVELFVLWNLSFWVSKHYLETGLWDLLTAVRFASGAKKGFGSVLTKSGFTAMQNTESSMPLTSYSVITLSVSPLCLETSKITGESLLRFCVQRSQAEHWQPLELLMKESKSSHVSCFVQSRVGDSCYARKLVSLCLCLSTSSSGLCSAS